MNTHDSHSIILRVAMAMLAVAILAGCGQSADEPTSTSPLLITAQSSSTRAGDEPLGDKYSDFGVWAWKTNPGGTSSLVMGHPVAAEIREYYTRLLAGKWNYEYSDAYVTQYLKYWDREALDYTFVAYAPYQIDATPLYTTHTITATSAGVNISPVSGNLSLSAGIDWLEARWKRQMTPTLKDIDLIKDTDHATSQFDDVVPLVFHHILAATEFRIYSDANELTIRSLSISLEDAEAIYTVADYEAGSWTNYSDATKATNLFTLGAELLLKDTSKANYYSLTTLVQLPQNVVGRTVNVVAEDSSGSKRYGSFTLPEGWEGETKYIYYLCIKGNEIILIDSSAESWIKGDDITITDPIENW